MKSLEQLIDVIHQRKLQYKILSNDTKGSIVLLEHGARVIGLFPSSDSPNALWVNPDLASLPNSNWNSGGDRIWLSPEIQFNIPEISQMNSYEVQRHLDPGDFRFSASSNHPIVLQQTAKINAFRANGQFEFDMTKIYRQSPDPLKSIPSQPLQYDFIGYQQRCEINRLDHGIDLMVSLWSIMQVPFPGKAWISTFGQSSFTDFIDDQYQSGVNAYSHGILMEFNGTQRRKISVKSIFASGRVGYIQHISHDEVMLIVRHFHVDPVSFYPDVRLSDLQDYGYCVQCYKDDGSLGYFGELEYHSPSVLLTKTNSTIHDTSSVWCYRGNKQTIDLISNMLLGTTYNE
jgi:hypothetical protein